MLTLGMTYLLLIHGGCEDKVTVFPKVSLETAYTGYVYVPDTDVQKGYVRTKSMAPPVAQGYVPLAGGKVEIGYDTCYIMNDGSFNLPLTRTPASVSLVNIYDSAGDLIATYRTLIENRSTVAQKIELVGGKGYYTPRIYRLDLQMQYIKNAMPRAWAGPDKIVLNNHKFILHGYAYDWDSCDSTNCGAGSNDIIKYEWQYQCDGKVRLATSLTGTVEIGTAEICPGPHDMVMKVTDHQGNVAADTMRLIVNTTGIEDTQPVAGAGCDVKTHVFEMVTLDGSGSYDEDAADLLTYAWEQVAGPVVALDNYTIIKPSFTPSETGLYVFGLRVKDNKACDISQSEYDFVNVWVETRETSTTPYIVFHSNMDASGYYYLYTMNPQGANIQKLPTFDLYHSFEPVFSRDGQNVFFVSNYGGRGNQLFRVNISSGVANALTTDYENSSPAASPTADWIAYVSTRTGKKQIFIVDYQGNAPDPATQRVPYQLMVDTNNQSDPCFTYDGSVLYTTDSDEVATGNRNIYKVRLLLDTGEITHDNADLTRLTATADDEHAPASSITGTIAYIRKRAGFEEVWKMSADGTSQQAVVTSCNCRDPHFTSDGQKILFSSIQGGDGNYEIYSYDLNTGSTSTLTSNIADNGHPDYNPIQ